MAASSNLKTLKAAYKKWRSTEGDANAWIDIMHDTFRHNSMGNGASEVAFADAGQSKSDMKRYFDTLLDGWTMVDWVPEKFVDGGNEIAMFGRCSWKNKKTGKTADVSVAHLWTFSRGKLVGLNEVFDSLRLVDAARD